MAALQRFLFGWHTAIFIIPDSPGMKLYIKIREFVSIIRNKEIGMGDLLTYKDYFGSVEYSPNDRVFWGKIEFINDSVTFEAVTVDDLEREFREAVDDYLETCKLVNKKPEKSFKGQFNVRISPELHKKAAVEASCKKISLNKFVENAISHELTLNYCAG